MKQLFPAMRATETNTYKRARTKDYSPSNTALEFID